MTNPLPDLVRKLYIESLELALRRKLEYKVSVRRTVGTADWKHDPDRVTAAENKRERKRLQRTKTL